MHIFEESARKWKLPINAGTILVPNESLGLLIANQLNHHPKKRCRAKWLDKNIIETEDESILKCYLLVSVKGLEFPFVAVIGLEEGKLPLIYMDLKTAKKRK